MMKSLLLKTLLIVFAVTVTGILAFAKLPDDDGITAVGNDPMVNRDALQTMQTPEGSVSCPVSYGSCTSCCLNFAKRSPNVRLTDNTNPAMRTQQREDPAAPSKSKSNSEGSGE